MAWDISKAYGGTTERYRKILSCIAELKTRDGIFFATNEKQIEMIKKSKALLGTMEKFQDQFQNGNALVHGFQQYKAHEVGLRAQVAIDFLNDWATKLRAANDAPAGPSPVELEQTKTIAKLTAEVTDLKSRLQKSQSRAQSWELRWKDLNAEHRILGIDRNNVRLNHTTALQRKDSQIQQITRQRDDAIENENKMRKLNEELSCRLDESQQDSDDLKEQLKEITDRQATSESQLFDKLSDAAQKIEAAERDRNGAKEEVSKLRAQVQFLQSQQSINVRQPNLAENLQASRLQSYQLTRGLQHTKDQLKEQEMLSNTLLKEIWTLRANIEKQAKSSVPTNDEVVEET